MGKRGPAKTPTNLTILRGNPGHRPINKDEPKPKSTKVRCPQNLTPQAKLVWKRNAPELISLGLLTNADIDEFSRYCEVTAQYEIALKWLHEHGSYYPVYDTTYGTCPHCRKQVEIEIILNSGECYRCGNYVENIKGNLRYLQQPPHVSIFRNCAELASKLGTKFGMSPSARTGLKIPQKEIDEVDDFLFGGNKK